MGTVLDLSLARSRIRSKTGSQMRRWQLAGELAYEHQGDGREGQHAVPFNADHLPSGVYVYRLETEQGAKAGKMILAK